MTREVLTPLLAFGALCASAQTAKRPNILYIMTDDHSQQTISCYDGRFNNTPGLDRIANQGIRFENSFVANSLSGPSRACLLTGKHSHANGFYSNEGGDKFDGAQQTFPKLLQSAGYTTAVIGKWHLVSDPTGFDYWEILPAQGSYYNPDFYTSQGRTHTQGYATDITTDKGIAWIDQHKGDDKPFCLLLHYKAVHRNWMSDSTHINMYEDVEFPVPANFFDNYDSRAAAAAQQMSIDKDMDLTNDNKMLHDSLQTRLRSAYVNGELARMNSTQRALWDKHYEPLIAEFYARYKSGELSGRALAEWKYQRYMRDYLKCVASLDDNIARTLDYLEREGLLDNTIVVYTSDQGFYMGEHGWFDKRFMYEESMHTPLLVRMPNSALDAPRGVVSQAMVQNIDHAATFLEIAGVDIPADIHGESYLPTLHGAQQPDLHADGLYYHFYEYPGEHQVRRHEGVRTDRYKLIHFYGHDIDAWELYDLKSDRSEMHNIYGMKRYSKIQNSLHLQLSALKSKYNATKE